MVSTLASSHSGLPLPMPTFGPVIVIGRMLAPILAKNENLVTAMAVCAIIDTIAGLVCSCGTPKSVNMEMGLSVV